MARKGAFWSGLVTGLLVGVLIAWGGRVVLVELLGGHEDAAPWLYRIVCLVVGAGVLASGLAARRRVGLGNTGTMLLGWGTGMILLSVLATALRV